MTRRRDILAFLASPDPPPGTRAYAEWKRVCLALGPACIDAFLSTLVHGTEGEQLNAFYGLRIHGFDVWADGYDEDYRYQVTAPGETAMRIIEPRIKPTSAR